MRFLMTVSIPVDAGNESAKKDGFQAIRSILDEQKPEAAYFIAENGKRTGLLIVNMDDASGIPALAEPWFLALNAAVDLRPVMVAGDLEKAAPAIEQAVKTYG